MSPPAASSMRPAGQADVRGTRQKRPLIVARGGHSPASSSRYPSMSNGFDVYAERPDIQRRGNLGSGRLAKIVAEHQCDYWEHSRFDQVSGLTSDILPSCPGAR